MAMYVETTALLKKYIDEPDRYGFIELLESDPDWVCGEHTYIQVRRVLGRETAPGTSRERSAFEMDWALTSIVSLDQTLCTLAADLAATTGAGAVDALHLAAAQRVGGGRLPFLTADVRLAQVARTLNWTVLGA